MQEPMGEKPLAEIESKSPSSSNNVVAFLDKVIPAPNSLMDSDLSNISTVTPFCLKAHPVVKPDIPAPIIATRPNTILPWS